ncbi:MAG: hypothetical protein JW910_16765 [Anaerolineae bacterium]|nr:hypothetical protein [Anaerolineae bacterium]
MSKIIKRIERAAGVAGLASLLAERLAPTDMQSLLLEVFRLRAGQRTPAAVLAHYENNRFVQPASISPRLLNEWERAAFLALPPAFEAVELSPVAPLGASSVIGSIDQNWVVSTIRNTEVVSDSTTVLALECARRRRRLLRENTKSAEAVHLAASHRLLRAQFFGDDPNLFSHFNIFSLCSAGRDQGGLTFEVAALGLHMHTYLQALRSFLGLAVPLRVTLTDFNLADRQAWLEAQLLNPLRQAFTGVDCAFDETRTIGQTYYHDLCFHVYARTAAGGDLVVADGGVVTWTQSLLSNAKERMVTSGIAGERVCKLFTLLHAGDDLPEHADG